MIETTDITIIVDQPENELSRSVTLTNEQWAILAMCAESYSDTYRSRCSKLIATYVTRGQLDQAVSEAQKMNGLLQQLDKLQAKLV